MTDKSQLASYQAPLKLDSLLHKVFASLFVFMLSLLRREPRRAIGPSSTDDLAVMAGLRSSGSDSAANSPQELAIPPVGWACWIRTL